MIPFEPEALEQLKDRFTAALEPVYDVRTLICGAIRPGEQRRHVFDTMDGIRLIVSRDRDPRDKKVKVHLSASVSEAATTHWVKRGLEAFMDQAMAAFFFIANKPYAMKLIGVTPDKGVPHWQEYTP